MDWALTEGGNVGNPGSINDAETSYSGYTGSYLDGTGDGMIARYEYAFGDYAVAVSVEQGVLDEENGYAIGFKGAVAGFTFGIAHQEGVAAAVNGLNPDLTGVSLGYGFGDIKVGIMYATGDAIVGGVAVDDDRLQLGVGYSAGPLSLHANYAERDLANVQSDGFGLAAKYDFGGGLSAHFGYSDASVGAAASVDKWSLGMAMSF
jgi:outer membrane protein OmpU